MIWGYKCFFTGWENQSSWGNQGYSMYQGFGGHTQGSYSGYGDMNY